MLEALKNRLPRIPRLARRALVAGGLLGLSWVSAAFGLDRYGRARVASGRWDAIVVAGAQVWRGGRPSKALERRTLAAVTLFKAGHAPRIVLTGGLAQHPPAAARVAAALAKTHGVPESAIVIEDRSESTLQNAAFTRELIGPLRVLVVTDAYHVLRSEIVYAHFFPEVKLVGVPLGRHAPIGESLREVAALAALLVLEVPRWVVSGAVRSPIAADERPRRSAVTAWLAALPVEKSNRRRSCSRAPKDAVPGTC